MNNLPYIRQHMNSHCLLRFNIILTILSSNFLLPAKKWIMKKDDDSLNFSQGMCMSQESLSKVRKSTCYNRMWIQYQKSELSDVRSMISLTVLTTDQRHWLSAGSEDRTAMVKIVPQNFNHLHKLVIILYWMLFNLSMSWEPVYHWTSRSIAILANQ